MWTLVRACLIALVVALAQPLMTFAAAKDRVVLRLALADEKTPKEELDKLFAPFEASHPDIDLEVTALYGNNLDKLTTETIAGVGADVFTTYNESTVLSSLNGFNLDLTPYIRRDRWEGQLRDFLPPTLNLMRRGDGLYGLPQYQSVGAIYFNRPMFDESGLVYPDGSWNWDEFARVSQRLTRVQDGKVVVSGFTQYPEWVWFFPWLEQAGVSFEEPAVVPLDDPKAIQAVEFVHGLFQRGYVTWGWPGPFLEKRSAMTHSGGWELKYWVKQNLTMGLTAPPRGSGGRSTLANTDIISISRNTKHPEEAWTFLKWFYTPEVQRQYLGAFGLQPARLSLVGEWIESIRRFYQANGAPPVEGLQAFINNSAFARPQPFFANPRVIREDINPALSRVFTQNVPIRSTLETMAKAATRKLAEAKQAK